MAGVEWTVAWRYLREREGRPWWVLSLGLALLAAAGAAALFEHRLGGSGSVSPEVLALLGQVKLGAGVAGLLVACFGVALLLFNLFTAISVFGVFLGVTALIVVLAVMSGFETDMRAKILGNNAHILVTSAKEDEGLDEKALTAFFRKVVADRSHGVVAAAPFLKGEVILTGPKSHGGVYLKGIDPVLADRTSDLGKNVVEGQLDNLLHPERLLYLFFPGQDLEVVPLEGGEPAAATGVGEPDAREARPSRPGPLERLLEEPAGSGKANRDATGLPRAARPTRPAASSPKVALPEGAEEFLKNSLDADSDALLGPAGPPGGMPSLPPLREAADRVYPGIIVGRELAKTLGLTLGQTVDVVTTDTNEVGPLGPVPTVATFRVAGVFYSGHYEYDTKYAYVLLSEAQKFLQMKGRITGVEIRIQDASRVDSVAAWLRRRLGGEHEIEVATWKQIHRRLFAAMKLEKMTMFLVLAIIVCVASFSIGANLIMVVRRKRGEIATLKAMGADDRLVYRVFLLNGVYVGGLGIGVGLLVGLGVCAFLALGGLPLNPDIYYRESFPVNVRLVDLLSVCAASMGISLAATLYPAWQAARLHPVEAFRAE